MAPVCGVQTTGRQGDLIKRDGDVKKSAAALDFMDY